MEVIKEFDTVNLIIGSQSDTRGVDAFALSLIKAERQIRKLLTFLVYQSQAFNSDDIVELRKILGSFKNVYFEGFLNGINKLSLVGVESLVGHDFTAMHSRLKEAIEYRNKIFHGQLTNAELSTADLLGLVADIRKWCELLAVGANKEFGYDGFQRNSFRKSTINISKKLKIDITTCNDYSKFIKNHMTRK